MWSVCKHVTHPGSTLTLLQEEVNFGVNGSLLRMPQSQLYKSGDCLVEISKIHRTQNIKDCIDIVQHFDMHASGNELETTTGAVCS